MTGLQVVLGAGSGGLVGLMLGLVGGGGSILAVPLMIYVVGVHDPHVAIGTSALAVAANAAVGLFHHARQRNVIWRCGGMYALAGIVGALAGSTLGKHVDGARLLFLFALVMILVGIMMLRDRHDAGVAGAVCDRGNAAKVLAFGFGTGAFSGFFGIGGGFLVVPGLVGSTGMPMLNAVGTSLVAVTAFGLATSLNYALSGLVDWPLAGAFIVGGAMGSLIGARVAKRLAGTAGRLTTVFAIVILIVAAYMLWRGSHA